MVIAATLAATATPVAAAVAYGAVVYGHLRAYTTWTEEDEHLAVALHLASIAGHLASVWACAALARPALGAITIVVTNGCHNWLIHLWNTVLATTAHMSRMRLQGVNDLTCTLALSYSAVVGCRMRDHRVRAAVAVLLVVHASLFLGQAAHVPLLDRLVVAFYPETVVREGGPLHSCFNVVRWLAVQSDIVSSTFLTARIVQNLRHDGHTGEREKARRPGWARAGPASGAYRRKTCAGRGGGNAQKGGSVERTRDVSHLEVGAARAASFELASGLALGALVCNLTSPTRLA
eukprot:2907578-Prymnesium_polylepis.1